LSVGVQGQPRWEGRGEGLTELLFFPSYRYFSSFSFFQVKTWVEVEEDGEEKAELRPKLQGSLLVNPLVVLVL